MHPGAAAQRQKEEEEARLAEAQTQEVVTRQSQATSREGGRDKAVRALAEAALEQQQKAASQKAAAQQRSDLESRTAVARPAAPDNAARLQQAREEQQQLMTQAALLQRIEAPTTGNDPGSPSPSASTAGAAAAAQAQVTRAEAVRQAREKQQRLANEVAILHAERVAQMRAASRQMLAQPAAQPAPDRQQEVRTARRGDSSSSSGSSGQQAASGPGAQEPSRRSPREGEPSSAAAAAMGAPPSPSPQPPSGPTISGGAFAPEGSYEAERLRRLEGDRALRQQQDLEFLESLARDQQRSAAAAAQQAADSAEGGSTSNGGGRTDGGGADQPPASDAISEQEAARRERLVVQREALRAGLAPEPGEDQPDGTVVSVRVRLTDGSFVTRRFGSAQVARDVKEWVQSSERMSLWEMERWQLVTVAPRRVIDSATEEVSDIAAGFSRIVLFVEETSPAGGCGAE